MNAMIIYMVKMMTYNLIIIKSFTSIKKEMKFILRIFLMKMMMMKIIKIHQILIITMNGKPIESFFL